MAKVIIREAFSPYGISKDMRNHVIWTLPLDSDGVVQKNIGTAPVRVMRVINKATGAIISEDVYVLGGFTAPKTRRRSRIKPKNMASRLVESSVLQRSIPPELADRPVQFNAYGDKGWWVAIRGRRIFIKSEDGTVNREVDRQSRKTFGQQSGGVSTATLLLIIPTGIFAGIGLAGLAATLGRKGSALRTSIGKFFGKSFQVNPTKVVYKHPAPHSAAGSYDPSVNVNLDFKSAKAILEKSPKMKLRRTGGTDAKPLYTVYQSDSATGNVAGSVGSVQTVPWDDFMRISSKPKAIDVAGARRAPIRGTTWNHAKKDILESAKYSPNPLDPTYGRVVIAEPKGGFTVQDRGNILPGLRWTVPAFIRRPPAATSGGMKQSYIYDIKTMELVGQTAPEGIIFANTKFRDPMAFAADATPVLMTASHWKIYEAVAGASRAGAAKGTIPLGDLAAGSKAALIKKQAEWRAKGEKYNVVPISGTNQYKLVHVGSYPKAPVPVKPEKLKPSVPMEHEKKNWKNYILKGKSWKQGPNGRQKAVQFLKNMDKPQNYKIVIIDGKYRIASTTYRNYGKRSGEEFYTEERRLKASSRPQPSALLLGSKRGGVVYISKLFNDAKTMKLAPTRKLVGWLTGLKLADVMFDLGLKRNVPQLKRFIDATSRRAPSHLRALRRFGKVAIARAAFSELAAKKGYGQGLLSGIYAPTSQYNARLFTIAWRAILRLGVV